MDVPKIGDRVVLSANEDEGWEREHAEVLEIDGTTITVRVDESERQDPHDDGLREVTLSQIEEAS